MQGSYRQADATLEFSRSSALRGTLNFDGSALSSLNYLYDRWKMAPTPDDDPLIVGSLFNYRNRPRRDTFWGVLYLIVFALTVIGGVYGVSHR
jgi:hypothetical protein